MNNLETNKIIKLINDGNFASAEALLDEVLAKGDDRTARYLKGVVFAKTARLEEAESGFLRLIEENPDDIDALNALALVYRRQNKLKDALGIFNEALDRDQTRADFYYHIADIQILEKNLKAAFMAYAKVIEFDPDFAPAYNNLGIVYYENQEFNKAVNILRQGVNLAGNNPKFHFNYAIALTAVEMLREALHEYEIALEIKPMWTSALNNLGIIQAKLGSLDQAGGSFDLILDDDPFNPEAWNNLGVVLAKQGFKEEALNHFRRALEARDAYEDAKMNIEALEQNRNNFVFSAFDMMLDEDIDIRLNALKTPPAPVQGEYLGVPVQQLAELFKYLKDMTAFLPEKDREIFRQSVERISIEHIINTLEGRRGILQELRETKAVETANGENPPVQGLKTSELTDFLVYLEKLTGNIQDASMAELLASKIKKAAAVIK